MKVLIIIALLIAFYLIYTNSTDSMRRVSKFLNLKTEKKGCSSCSVKEQYIDQIQFIDQVFTYLSKNDKVVLKNNCIKNSYNTPNIPDNVDDEINTAMSIILGESNKLCCAYFVLRQKNSVLVEENEEGSRYIVDGMLHEINDHMTIRYVADYTKIKDERFLNYISVINTSVYNLRKPPANSSLSCNNLGREKGENVEKMDVSQFDADWSSRLTDLYNKSYKVIGVGDSTLESSTIDFVKRYNTFSFIDKNKWIVPFDQMGRNSDFCKKQENEWDRFGANISSSVGDGCLMHNSAVGPRNVLPNVNPNKVGVISEYGYPDNSQDAWLFNSGEFGNLKVESGASWSGVSDASADNVSLLVQ